MKVSSARSFRVRRGPAHQAMASGQCGHHVLLQERMDGKALRIGQARADEGDVEPLLAQAGQKLG